MGKRWDATGIAYDMDVWKNCLQVLKPGGHLVAFGGTRTYHRLVCAIEDAGFEIRDSLHWIYGSGFPKSLDVSKAIDKAAGAERDVLWSEENWGASKATEGKTAFGDYAGAWDITSPATPEPQEWQGWGTALKPAHEPIVLARKPLTGTVARNVLEHGTGALNIDGCRVGSARAVPTSESTCKTASVYGKFGAGGGPANLNPNMGRWPPNILLSHSPACDSDCASDCPVAELDRQSGLSRAGSPREDRGSGGIWAPGNGVPAGPQYGDSGGASRFFPCFRYQPKAPAKERPRLTDGMSHPTVKPVALMRWLVRLVTPPGGSVLDPFAGTGTTGQAALAEGFRAVLIERDAGYIELINQRLGLPEGTT
jgi:hypothetical protein